jgi:hypothetical protein
MLRIAPQDEVEAPVRGAPQNDVVGYAQEPHPLMLDAGTRSLVDEAP